MSGPVDKILRTVGDVKPDTHPGERNNHQPPEPGRLLPERRPEDHQAPGNHEGVDADFP